MPLALLDRQHGIKSGAFDPGAMHGDLRETDLTMAYLDACAQRLQVLGWVVKRLDSGTYDRRHAQARAWAREYGGPCVYAAGHVNAGKGRYALVEYDARSKAGQRAAAALALSLSTLPGISKGKTIGLSEGERGFVCIDGVYAGPANVCAVLLEPGFVDTESHAHLWTSDGLRLVGEAVARGLVEAVGRAVA